MLLVVWFGVFGCTQKPADTHPPISPQKAEMIWKTHCKMCHKVQSLRAKNVTQMKRAMDQTPDMKAVRGKFADHELAGILIWLDRME